jgi:hypothetical protein
MVQDTVVLGWGEEAESLMQMLAIVFLFGPTKPLPSYD